jgi:hypothetical protein
VVETSEISGDSAISKIKLGRMNVCVIWQWDQRRSLKHWHIYNTLNLVEFCKTAVFKEYIDWKSIRNFGLCGVPVLNMTEGLSYQFKGLEYNAMLISYLKR